jgi:2-keto-4-pentenoate hydratase
MQQPNALFAEQDRDWLTLEDAYALQRSVAVRRARGERCVGYKVGCVSSAIQKQLGLDEPVRGYLWANERHESGACLDSARYVNLAIEGELALQLCRVPSSQMWEKELDCIERCLPALELHQVVFRGRVATSQELIAGNAMHAGFVVPSSEPDESSGYGSAYRSTAPRRNSGSKRMASPSRRSRWMNFQVGRWAHYVGWWLLWSKTVRSSRRTQSCSPGRLAD